MTLLPTGAKASHRTCGLHLIALGVLAGSLLSANAASAQTLTTLASFNNIDGANPVGVLIADANGNLFGTTNVGGASGLGTVFELAKTSTGYASSPTTLASFNNYDGSNPYGALLADASGNLFGTTNLGGASSAGTVFELVKTSTGYASAPTTLVSFTFTDGAYPYAGLIADATGNLFGTTFAGGTGSAGTLFEIVKTSTGFASIPTTIINFDSIHNGNSVAPLIADANGNLFGTTRYGGSSGVGTVFELAKTSTGYAAAPTTLVTFNSIDGAQPLFAQLIADASGNLYGTTYIGGTSSVGTVFEIAKTSTGYATTPTTLFSFNHTDGAYPYGGLLIDAAGNLFSTTEGGGTPGVGTVFKLAKTSTGYATAPTTVVSFNTTNGSYPFTGLLVDSSGILYGTTLNGGASGAGTVFELTGSGFVVPSSTPPSGSGSCGCNGESISTLAKKYGGLANAAKALGYDSVQDLQRAIAHCDDKNDKEHKARKDDDKDYKADKDDWKDKDHEAKTDDKDHRVDADDKGDKDDHDRKVDKDDKDRKDDTDDRDHDDKCEVDKH